MVRSYAREGEQPATSVEALREQYTNDDLARLVRAFGLGKPPMRKDEMVGRLVRLVEGDALRDTWAKLAPLEQAAAAETAWSEDGRLDRERFRAKYGRVPAGRRSAYDEYDEGDEDDEGDEGDAEDALAARAARVVPMFGNPRRQERPASLLEVVMPYDVMARDLQKRLRAMVPRPAPAAVRTVDAPPDHVDQRDDHWDAKSKSYQRVTVAVPVVRRDMERAAAHDLFAVLRLIDAGKVSITDKNRWPTPAAIRAVAAVLDGGDYYPDEVADEKNAGKGGKKGKVEDEWDELEQPGPIRAFAWPVLAQAGRLAQVSGKRLALTKAGRAALAAPPHETLRELWRRWVETDVLDELRRVNVIRGQTGGGRRHLVDPAKRRQAIEEGLCECPVGQWVSLDDFSRYLRAAGHVFEVTRDAWKLYIFEQHYGSLGYEGYGDWNILQFRYLLALLMEYAATLGMIDVAYIPPAGARHDYGSLWGTDDLAFFSRYDGLLYLRLNALGAYCLGLSETYVPPPAEARHVLEVRPDLEIVAADGGAALTAADRISLEAWAVPVREGVWRLDPEKVLAAAAEGRDLEEAAAFLESASGDVLPQEAAAFFADMARRRDALRDLGPARLLRCEDAELVRLLADRPSIRDACYLIEPNLVLVPAKSEAAFRRAVRKMGYVLPDRPGDVEMA